MNKSQIQALYKEFAVPTHIQAHMLQVKNVAEILAKALIEKNIEVDLQTVIDASLLHDILRPCDFRDFDEKELLKEHSKETIEKWKEMRSEYGDLGHAEAASKILIEMGEHKLAQIICKHDFFKVYDLESWEEKIVYYADKRIDLDQIVSLKDRLTEGAKRNQKDEDDDSKRKKTIQKIFELEKEFIKELGKLPI